MLPIVQVGSADPAVGDIRRHLPGTDRGFLHIFHAQVLGPVHHNCLHCNSLDSFPSGLANPPGAGHP